jgi:hypothetical protein
MGPARGGTVILNLLPSMGRSHTLTTQIAVGSKRRLRAVLPTAGSVKNLALGYRGGENQIGSPLIEPNQQF